MRGNCFNNILAALNISDNLHIIFAILEVIEEFTYFRHLPAVNRDICVVIISHIDLAVAELMFEDMILLALAVVISLF